MLLINLYNICVVVIVQFFIPNNEYTVLFGTMPFENCLCWSKYYIFTSHAQLDQSRFFKCLIVCSLIVLKTENYNVHML